MLALVLYMWGCRSDPLNWNFEAILPQLGKLRSGVRSHMEIWLLVRGTCLLAEGKECIVGATFVEGHVPPEGDPLAPDHFIWSGLEGRPLWEGVLMSKELLGRSRVVEWDLVSCGVLVVEHLFRIDAPILMTWREMVKAWPRLRERSGAKEAWLRVCEDLGALGVEEEWGHRIGGRDAREVWEMGAWSDRRAEEPLGEGGEHLREMLDQVARPSRPDPRFAMHNVSAQPKHHQRSSKPHL